MPVSILRPIISLLFLAAFLPLVACSTLPQTGPETRPPLRRYEDVVKPTEGERSLLQVSDPIAGFNRGAYRFNYYFDRYLLFPVIRGYRFVMPDYGEERVSRFFDNIYEIGNFTNSLLQLKWRKAGITTARFVINSTVGVAGLWDPATGWGLHRQNEDFGQTMGHYGVGSGAYVVLPVFGPSSVRDTGGLVVDAAAFSAIDPLNFEHNEEWSAPFYVLGGIDKRKRIPFRYYGSGSPFEYELVRMLMTQKRQFDVAN